jgi:tRNA threonylcarbamoyladenosine biosynthesis protein TsaB
MRILAFEFSTSRRSVAVLNAGSAGHGRRGDPAEPFAEAERVDVSAQANIPAMIETVLRQAGLEREQIDLLGVALGPGSYTGVRTSLALVQGWQLARGIPAVGISTAHCLARDAAAAGLTGPLNIVIDAQRDEFYIARYEICADSNRELEPLHIEKLDQIRARERDGQILAGPGLERWFPAARSVFPSATSTARLSLERFEVGPTPPLEPIYLREVSFVKAPPARLLPPEG